MKLDIFSFLLSSPKTKNDVQYGCHWGRGKLLLDPGGYAFFYSTCYEKKVSTSIYGIHTAFQNESKQNHCKYREECKLKMWERMWKHRKIRLLGLINHPYAVNGMASVAWDSLMHQPKLGTRITASSNFRIRKGFKDSVYSCYSRWQSLTYSIIVLEHVRNTDSRTPCHT